MRISLSILLISLAVACSDQEAGTVQSEAPIEAGSYDAPSLTPEEQASLERYHSDPAEAMRQGMDLQMSKVPAKKWPGLKDEIKDATIMIVAFNRGMGQLPEGENALRSAKMRACVDAKAAAAKDDSLSASDIIEECISNDYPVSVLATGTVVDWNAANIRERTAYADTLVKIMAANAGAPHVAESDEAGVLRVYFVVCMSNKVAEAIEAKDTKRLIGKVADSCQAEWTPGANVVIRQQMEEAAGR